MGIYYMFIMMVYVVALYMFGAYIILSETIENLMSVLFFELPQLNSTYDYIVVGCGSAGSVVAHRLSQDSKTSVLVLEAGPFGNSWFDIPAVGPVFQQSSIDWSYNTNPQTNAANGFNNKVLKWPMGRIVGGSGRINNMVYVRGHPNDFNEWFKDVPGYTFEKDILHYFKRAEDQRGRYLNDSNYHGTGGPFKVEDLRFVSILADAFLKGAEELGYPVRDLNAEHTTGFMQPQVNTYFGKRWAPSHALRKQKNLSIHTNALVHNVLFKNNYEAYGVKFSSLGQTKMVKARKGVILSAGVIGTPKILMLSGIGPKDHLQNMKIEVKVNLPVGNNLQDHVTTGSDLVLLNTSIGVNPFSMLSPKALFNYFYNGMGPWTLSGCEVIGILDTSFTNSSYNKFKHKKFTKDKLEHPDLQFMVVPIGVSTDGGMHLRKVSNIKDEIWEKYFVPLIGKEVISVLPIVLHPKSRGTVRLKDRNPYNKPVIEHNYLSHPYDVEILLRGIAFIKEIIKTDTMQKLGAKLNTNRFPGCETLDFDTELYWKCYVRHFTLTSFHPAGTCKMGIAKDTVVDYSFAVHNVSKLYVVDASVMPSLTSGNINAAVVMLAEKASDIIRLNDYLSSGLCNIHEIFVQKTVCISL